jgi:hydrogenase maturation protein HypF
MRAGDDTLEKFGTRVRVRGLVQGVGFRPFVWRLAQEESLAGHVLNDADGVLAEIWGGPEATGRFLERLKTDSPPLSRVDEVVAEAILGQTHTPDEGFRIVSSVAGDVSTGIVPDAATCPDCLQETLSPSDRRHGYAFTNCTHCGPRLSIIEAIPYDRANTSMAPFVMCSDCQAEYDNPADRRFHAQPNACPACGPVLWFEENGQRNEAHDPVGWTAQRLGSGEIVAIKGIGGFHLAVDATRSDAVERLRARKNRPHKPLALMVRDVEQARAICEVNDAEAGLLTSGAAPIVLLKIRKNNTLAGNLAPGQDRLGVMLPYTPLHHLLMAEVGKPIVLTSGNLSEDPQVIDNSEARTKLSRIADGFLMHDRAIVNRLDDSVVRVSASGRTVLRRARGYAPAPLPLPGAFKGAARVLAMGGELKSTFCLLRDGQAVVSQHMGDLEHRHALQDLKKNLELYRGIFKFDPEIIAVDGHPDYLSSQLGRQVASETGARVIEVQHHHAHLAACLAEAGVQPGDDETLAIILDGSGLGTDGTIWGGELLLGGYRGFERAGHFLPVALPGGAAAVREPWRNLIAHLQAAFGPGYRSTLDGSGILDLLRHKNLPLVDQMVSKGVNTPFSSSAGRLFDAVAAALGVCVDRQTYEGQTGSMLETMARPFLEVESGYPVQSTLEGGTVLSWKPLWESLLSDLRTGEERGRISARFHLALIGSLAETGCRIASAHGLERIALSGGVMQNSILSDGLAARIESHGLEVLLPRDLPANDGGICLGQAAIAVACGAG